MPSIRDSLQEMSSGFTRDLKCALQQMRRKPGVLGGSDPDARARPGNQHRGVFRTVCHSAEAGPIPQRRSIGCRAQQLSAAPSGRGCRPSVFDYLDLRGQGDLFGDVGLHYFLDLNHTGAQRPEKVNAVAMTASMFRTLGVKPLIGRVFTSEEKRSRGRMP